MTVWVCCVTMSVFPQTASDNADPSETTLAALKSELETIFSKDQTFRRIYLDAEKTLGKNSNEMAYFWEVVEAQDKVFQKKVTDIIDTYGWLSISQVGRLANATLWTVLQHGSVSSKEKYAPLLKASVLRNESQAIHYARLIDRMLVNSDKAQRYGTQIDYDSHETATFFEIERPEYINKRRKELGLPTIQEFSKEIGVAWTVD